MFYKAYPSRSGSTKYGVTVGGGWHRTKREQSLRRRLPWPIFPARSLNSNAAFPTTTPVPLISPRHAGRRASSARLATVARFDRPALQKEPNNPE